MPIITSRQNVKIRQVRALQQRKKRAAQGLFLVEGIRHVGEAAEAQAPLEYVLYAPDLLTSDYANELVGKLSRRGVSCHAVATDAFASVAGKDHPQGILAVARRVEISLEDLTPEEFPWGVAVVSPQDPGNVGSVLRTIDAAGASGLLLLDDGVDPYHPTAVRASMGALFWHPVVQASFDAFSEWAQAGDYHIYGTSARGGTDYRELSEFRRPAVLLLGGEREGLSLEQAGVCDQLLQLPMKGRSTSLNLAVAAGILLYAMQDKLSQG